MYSSVVSKHTAKLFTGSFDNSIAIRNLHSNKKFKHLRHLHSYYISAFLLLDKDRVLVSTGYDNKIVFYDLEVLRLVKSIEVDSFAFFIRWVAEFRCISFGGES